MRALKITGLAVLLIGEAGCASSGEALKLTIKVNPPVAARAELAGIIGGKEDLVPKRCDVPCTVEINPRMSYRLVVRADRYYPATVEFTHDEAVRASGEDWGEAQTGIVIPLSERSESSPESKEAGSDSESKPE
jgi:hypothetical protein